MSRWCVVGIAAIALLAALVSKSAANRQSATFDEIVLVSAGSRGLETGDWLMVTDQPPLLMYLYGAATRRGPLAYPPEDRSWDFNARWDYARAFTFDLNDPELVLSRARWVGSAMVLLIVLAAGGFAWWIAGPRAGLVAAASTALLPDVLAHGGVAYNDLGLAFAFLLACWALDVAIRRPSPVFAALAALAVVAAFGMKMSALGLIPVAGLLLLAEGWGRRSDAEWRKDAAVSAGVFLVATYVGLVLLYRGDPSLTLLRFNFWRTVLHSTGGHPAPAYLLGATSQTGWWYFFPVAFFFKTPLAFQALCIAAVGLLAAEAQRRGLGASEMIAWRGRAALVGAVVFGAFLMRSDLNVGFRYALPVLPLLAVLVGVGVTRRSPSRDRDRRVGVGVILGILLLTVGLSYPHFLGFTSVLAGDRDASYRVLSDSSVDWGQGLLELRTFMEREGVSTVQLSYFGSAKPEAYGIDYEALAGFLPPRVQRTAGAEADPRFTVISATNLLGLYFAGADPFASYREREPYAVLGGVLFVFDEEGG